MALVVVINPRDKDFVNCKRNIAAPRSHHFTTQLFFFYSHGPRDCQTDCSNLAHLANAFSLFLRSTLYWQIAAVSIASSKCRTLGTGKPTRKPPPFLLQSFGARTLQTGTQSELECCAETGLVAWKEDPPILSLLPSILPSPFLASSQSTY